MTSSVLFTPVGINRMTLKNRIVMPAMASYHAAVNGEATEKLIRYHEERAKGGVGMNIVEATYVARSGNSFDLGLGISDDFMIKGLSKLTDAVHRHDGKIAIQLQHGGRWQPARLRLSAPARLHDSGPRPHRKRPRHGRRRHRRHGRGVCTGRPPLRGRGFPPSSTAIPPWRTYRNGIDFGTNVELCRPPRTRASTPSTSRRECNAASS
ncbi:MAG: hypothetical protein ACLTTU_07715 [Bilophila wadsworthia]